MDILTDILIIGSAVSLITGLLSFFIKRIQINQKSRVYFLMALLLFALAVTLGWSDFIAGLNDRAPV